MVSAMDEKLAMNIVALCLSYIVLASVGGEAMHVTRDEITGSIVPSRHVNMTVQTGDGDVYDCVDIYKQPALSHPLFQNHIIQMEPSSFPTRLGINSSLAPAVSEAHLSTVDCPIGTVPILRQNKVDSMMIQHIRRIGILTPNDEREQELAGIKYWDDQIYGTRAAINVYKPTVNKDSKDLSASWVQLNNGPNVGDVTIGAGSWVAPGFSGDSFARFHILWVNEALNKTCADYTCPGFVQVSHNFGLGGRIHPISVYNGPQYIINVLIFKDINTKNWWLAFGEHAKVIGYWPSSQFSYLRDKAVHAYWGGYVLGPMVSFDPPQMGSGHFASEGYGKAAFVRDIQIVDKNNKLVNPDVGKAHAGTSDPTGTKYTYDGDGVNANGMHVYYGGPGNY